MPDSFLLPDEVRDFEHHLRQYPGQTFIAKPSKGRGGDGCEGERQNFESFARDGDRGSRKKNSAQIAAPRCARRTLSKRLPLHAAGDEPHAQR